jgi:hypothetical protein
MSVEVPSSEQTIPWRRNRNWLWVFVTFGALACLSGVIIWVWKRTEPLSTVERLNEARALWGQRRPSDYDLKIARTVMYKSSDGSTGTIVDKYFVQVRNGQVTGFLVNGREPEPLFKTDGSRSLDAELRQRESYDISGLFDAIEEFMAMDAREGRKSFLRARFDKSDGHLMLFSRQVDGLRNPYIQVDLKRVP